jgi:hypothetical protein
LVKSIPVSVGERSVNKAGAWDETFLSQLPKASVIIKLRNKKIFRHKLFSGRNKFEKYLQVFIVE